jgi:hypothetical protein
MKAKTLVFAAILLAVLGVAGLFGLWHWEDARFHSQWAELQAELEAEGIREKSQKSALPGFAERVIFFESAPCA